MTERPPTTVGEAYRNIQAIYVGLSRTCGEQHAALLAGFRAEMLKILRICGESAAAAMHMEGTHQNLPLTPDDEKFLSVETQAAVQRIVAALRS